MNDKTYKPKLQQKHVITSHRRQILCEQRRVYFREDLFGSLKLKKHFVNVYDCPKLKDGKILSICEGDRADTVLAFLQNDEKKPIFYAYVSGIVRDKIPSPTKASSPSRDYEKQKEDFINVNNFI
jgi:hypothetical protein